MTLFFKKIFSTLRWYTSIGAKLIRTVPGYTLTVVLATLASQLSLLLAFFLPLKVIILLGSSRIPRYFPQAWQAIERDHLVMGLSLAAAIFYLLYLLAEQLIGYCAEHGAKRLLEKSQKITLFNNQDEVATLAYQRYARSLAGTIFVALVGCGLAVVYPALLSMLAGYVLTALLLLSITHRLSKSWRAKWTAGLGKLPSTLAAVGFLLAFVFIVSGFLLGTAPGVLIAIVALLLVRQAMQRLAGLIVDIAGLSAQRLQINALFFHGHILLADSPSKDQVFWPLLEEPRRSQWLTAVLGETLGAAVARVESIWHQTGTPDVVAFEVTLSTAALDAPQRYLVKLFNSNRRELALQEATLLADCTALALPAPDFLGASLVDKLHCHVFRWHGEQKLVPRQVKTKALEVFARLMAIEPPGGLVARYERSRPYLWQRLDKALIERLRLAARDSTALEHIDCFAQAFERIQDTLRALPLQVVSPEVTADSLLCAADGELRVSQWGRWSLEPVGAGWPINEHDLKMLGHLLEQARLIRSKLAVVAEPQVVLSALMFAFERMLQRQQLLAAIDLLPAILNQVALSEANPPIP